MSDKLSKVTMLDHAAAAARFNYDVVAPERREALREDARQIRLRLIETAGAMMDIGERLVRSRSVLPHGTWLPWLVAETGMSVQWARNCINLFLKFADQPLLLSDLDLALTPTAIVRLVAAPEAAWEDVVDRVREWMGHFRDRLRLSGKRQQNHSVTVQTPHIWRGAGHGPPGLNRPSRSPSRHSLSRYRPP